MSKPAWEGNTQLPLSGRPSGQRDAAPPDTREILDPELRTAVETAYEAWARKYPHLVEDWPA